MEKVEILTVQGLQLAQAKPASAAPTSCHKGQQEDLTSQHQQLLALPQLDGNTCGVDPDCGLFPFR